MAEKRSKSLQDIATALGLSTATVSRAINDKPTVNSETRTRVLEYIQNAGMKRAVSVRRSDMIGIVGRFTDFARFSEDHYFSCIADGILRRTGMLGYHSVIIDPDTLTAEYTRLGRVQVLDELEGLIWVQEEYTERVDTIVKNQNIPSVVINHCSETIDQYVVTSDHYAGTRRVVEYLAGRGHEAIGFVGGYMDLQDHMLRYRGYADGMEAAGQSIEKDWIVDDITEFGREGGVEAMHRLLTTQNPPTAVILTNDNLAVGAYQGTREMGLRVPDDVSFVGFDDFPFAPYLDPPLTSMRQELSLLSETAADKLTALMGAQRPEPEKRTSFPMRIIVRSSVCSR